MMWLAPSGGAGTDGARAVGWFLLIFVTRDLGAVVGEAAESVVCGHM